MTDQNTEAITVHEALVPTDITSMALPVTEVVERARMVAEIMKNVMVRDVHYGIVPGTKKPSLWQPGAEKLMLTFRLAPDLEIEDLSRPPGPGDPSGEIRYRVTALIRHVPTGAIVGVGVGESSSNEEKYRWMAAICDEEWEATPKTRQRIKYKKKWAKHRVVGHETVQQIRTEPSDIANTVLKMAKKRALVDGAKSTCAASDIFDQDLEVLTGLGIDLETNGTEPIAKPKAKPPNGTTQPPPEREPGSDDEPLEPVASGGAAGAWEAAQNGWHEKGGVSEAQAGRLFAIARSNGWSSDDVVALILEHLGCTVEDLPWGVPYNTVVDIFQTHKAGELPD